MIYDIFDWIQSLPDWLMIPIGLLFFAKAAAIGLRIARSQASRVMVTLTIIWMLAAMVMNRAAMWSNGGRMPVYDPSMDPYMGPLVDPESPRHVEVGNGPGQIPLSSVRLPLLCDVIPVDLCGGRLVVSAGDLVVSAGLLSMFSAIALDLLRRRPKKRSPG